MKIKNIKAKVAAKVAKAVAKTASKIAKGKVKVAAKTGNCKGGKHSTAKPLNADIMQGSSPAPPRLHYLPMLRS